MASKEIAPQVDRMAVSEEATLAELEALYRGRYSDFLRVASAITGSREAGRDSVHDAFVSAVRSRETFRRRGTLEAWLWPIVLNAARKRCRSEREVPADDLAHESIWAREAEPHPEVRAEIAALPERQRLMLFLRYYADLDYRAIADITGVQIGTVGAELHAAHQALRRHLEEVPANG